MTTISVITVTYNSSHIIGTFLERVQSEGGNGNELIVVDSGSQDFEETRSITSRSGIKTVQSQKNIGYGRGNNVGVRNSDSDWIFFVNPDVDVTFAQIEKLVVSAEKLGASCIGPVIENDDGTIRTTWGRTVTPPWRRRSAGWKRDGEIIIAETISGCCMGISRDEFVALGGFDEKFFMFSEEMDLHRRIADSGGITACDLSIRVRTPGGGSSEGVTNRWRLVERNVGHTRYMFKHFTLLEGFIALGFNVGKMLLDDSFSPRRQSLSQFVRALGRRS